MEGYYTNTIDSVCRWNLNNLSPADTVALAEIKGFSRGMYVLIAALLLSTAICLYTMITHLLNYREKKCQRYMVRILLLIPLGGLVAVLNYHFYQYEHYLVLARGLYTGVAAVDLGLLLNATFGDDDCNLDEKSPFPFDTLKFVPPTNEQQSPLQQLLVNQFSIFQSASSIIGAILQGTKNMCPFDLNVNQPLPYLRATSVSSSLISIYSLLKLHKAGSLCFKDRVPKSTVVFFIILTFVPNIVSLGFELLVHYISSDKVIGSKAESATEMGLLLILSVLSPILASHRPFKSDEMPKTNGWESLRHAANYKDTLAAVGISLKYFSGAALGKPRNIPNPTFSQHDFAGKDFQNYTLHEESHSVAPLESAYHSTLASEKAVSTSLPKSLGSSFTQTETPDSAPTVTDDSKYTTTESSTSRSETEPSYPVTGPSSGSRLGSRPSSKTGSYPSRTAVGNASQTDPSIRVGSESQSTSRSATDAPSRIESEPYHSSRLVSAPASRNGTEPSSDSPSKKGSYSTRSMAGPASRNGSEPSAGADAPSRPGSESSSSSSKSSSIPNTESSTPSTTSTPRSNPTPGSAADSGSDPKYDSLSTPHTQASSRNSVSSARPNDYDVDIGSVDIHHLKSTELSHPALRTLTNQSYNRESILLAQDTIMSVAPAQPYTKAKYGTIDRDGNQISYKSPSNTRRVSALASDASARRPRRPLSTLEPKVSPQQPDKDQVRRPFSTYNALQ